MIEGTVWQLYMCRHCGLEVCLRKYTRRDGAPYQPLTGLVCPRSTCRGELREDRYSSVVRALQELYSAEQR